MMQVKDLPFGEKARRFRTPEMFALRGTFLSPGTSFVIAILPVTRERVLVLPRGTRDYRCKLIKTTFYVFPPAAPIQQAQPTTA